MSDARLHHLGALLDSKNRTVRSEAAAAFSKFSIVDDKVVQVLLKHLTSNSWDARVSAGDALQAILRNVDRIEESPGEANKEPSNTILEYCIDDVMRSFKPLLSENEGGLKVNVVISTKQQRQLIDQHLDVIAATGLSSKRFLSDSDVLPQEIDSSRSSDGESEELKADVKIEPTEQLEDTNLIKFYEFLQRLLPLLADQRWQCRHGAAIAMSKLFATSFRKITPTVVDVCVLLIIQVLTLDQFNDFITGRSATAPVRETCAQALGYVLNATDEKRKQAVLKIVIDMLHVEGEKKWSVRQSALLVMKYYFAIAKVDAELFDKCFQLVVKCLNDSVDDVVCCSVTTLSSILANQRISSDEEEKKQLVRSVLTSVWALLEVESKKEQLKSGLDALCIDLLNIVEAWLISDQEAILTSDQLKIVTSMFDASFPARNEKIVSLLDIDLDRSGLKLTAEESLDILKELYRILLFTAPSENLTFLEKAFLTSVKILKAYQLPLLESQLLIRKIGIWSGCLLYDHKNAMINLADHGVEGTASRPDRLTERMCSDEVLFLSDKEKDNVYVTRKILCAKFLAQILELLFESSQELDGQNISTSVQLLFANYFQSTSLMQNLGAALVVNEWASLYRAAVNQGLRKDPPMTLVSICDAFLRSPTKNFDELAASVGALTKDCNEFIDYCALRGFDKSTAKSDEASIEEISRTAFEICREKLKTEKQKESLETRFRLLNEFIHLTKTVVKSNTVRVYALLSSALFYFGSAPEKLTPQIRPLVEAMQSEDNEAVSTEIFRGSIPLLVAFSWSRQPKPYVKVMAKAIESFSSCPYRIPRRAQSLPETSIVTLDRLTGEGGASGAVSAQSKNAELILVICSTFSIQQMPEYYELFDLDKDVDVDTLQARLELHGCLWSRVGSTMSPTAAEKIFELLVSNDPHLRFSGAKAIETFARSQLGETMNKVHQRLTEMAGDIGKLERRKGAVEAFLRLSLLDTNLSGTVTLLCPPVFTLLTDPSEDIRDAAGMAFRRLVPLVALQESFSPIAGLNETLESLRKDQGDFINVLSSPSRLPQVKTEDVAGLATDVQLRQYQLEGITWMRFLRKYGLNGILADDMGLGKTLQTMCTIVLSTLKDDLPRNMRCSLIVCPRTLVDHWCLEWKRFFPSRPAAKKLPSRVNNAEVFVVAYEDLKTSSILLKQTWNYVVLDEGHVLRNPKTLIWRTAMDLKAKSRLVLSGTPVQNSPADLWALFTWLMPGYLGTDKQFRAQYLKKIIKCRSSKATDADLKDGATAIAQLHKLILPFVLRRLKSEVLTELPEKNVQDYECELSEQQKDIYRFIVDRCTSRSEELRSQRGISPLHALMALRKLVDHPCLIQELLLKMNAPKEMQHAASSSASSSGKLDALGQLLQECGICKRDEEEEKPADDEEVLLQPEKQSHRALIFCQWKTSARLVSAALGTGRFGENVSHLVLDGDVPPADRMSIVNRFNADPSIDVLILTTHIGGVGLNLTGADVVIFLDHDWNPMKDLQAIDRAHRLGQTRKVNVYRLITQGTVEQKVMSLHKFKVNTAQALIGADNTSLKTMETTELMDMFTLDDGAGGGGGDGTDAHKNTSGPSAKKAKKNNYQSTVGDEHWNLEEMWDESQYETFDVKHFLKDAN